MRVPTLVAVTCAVVVLAGCGSGLPGSVAARVGNASIDRATVNHWAKVMSLTEKARSTDGPNGTPRERALEFLIASNWLIEEASERGLTISDQTVARRLDERIASSPNGSDALKKTMTSAGKTLADVKFEIKAELVAARLYTIASRSVTPPTQADIVGYYRRRREQFRGPESRVADLIEGILGTRAEVTKLGKRMSPGPSFAEMAVRERVPRETPLEETKRNNGPLVRTIFTAVPGKVAGPVRYNDAWVLVVVREVVPGSIEPLANVKKQVAARVMSQRRRLAVFKFLHAYRDKWTEQTECAHGFVVQKCSQYHGPIAPERSPFGVGSQ